jgi:hypothetical protein
MDRQPEPSSSAEIQPESDENEVAGKSIDCLAAESRNAAHVRNNE